MKLTPKTVYEIELEQFRKTPTQIESNFDDLTGT